MSIWIMILARETEKTAAPILYVLVSSFCWGISREFLLPPMNASDRRSFIKWNGIPYQKVLVTVRLVLMYHFIFLYSCSSYVGMIGGRQRVSLGRGCHRLGTAAHEFGKCFYFPAVKDKGFVECQKIFNKNCYWLSVHTKMISGRFQNSPLWGAFFKICVFGHHFDMIRVDFLYGQNGEKNSVFPRQKRIQYVAQYPDTSV